MILEDATRRYNIPIQGQRRNAIVVVLYRETEKIFMSSETLSLLLGVDVSTYEDCGVATSAIQDTVSRLRNQVNSTIESHCAGFMGSSTFSFKVSEKIESTLGSLAA